VSEGSFGGHRLGDVEMEPFPALKIGWLNGWLPMGILYLIFGILLLVFPREVVRRLYERSGWSREQKVITLIGKSMALVWFPLIIFTPLKIGTPVFALGMVLFALTVILVMEGPYRVIRHPGYLAEMVYFSVLPIILSRWVPFTILAAICIVVAIASCAYLIRAEDRFNLRKWGEEYRQYMKEVPAINFVKGLKRLKEGIS